MTTFTESTAVQRQYVSSNDSDAIGVTRNGHANQSSPGLKKGKAKFWRFLTFRGSRTPSSSGQMTAYGGQASSSQQHPPKGGVRQATTFSRLLSVFRSKKPTQQMRPSTSQNMQELVSGQPGGFPSGAGQAPGSNTLVEMTTEPRNVSYNMSVDPRLGKTQSRAHQTLELSKRYPGLSLNRSIRTTLNSTLALQRIKSFLRGNDSNSHKLNSVELNEMEEPSGEDLRPQMSRSTATKHLPPMGRKEKKRRHRRERQRDTPPKAPPKVVQRSFHGSEDPAEPIPIYANTKKQSHLRRNVSTASGNQTHHSAEEQTLEMSVLMKPTEHARKRSRTSKETEQGFDFDVEEFFNRPVSKPKEVEKNSDDDIDVFQLLNATSTRQFTQHQRSTVQQQQKASAARGSRSAHASAERNSAAQQSRQQQPVNPKRLTPIVTRSLLGKKTHQFKLPVAQSNQPLSRQRSRGNDKRTSSYMDSNAGSHVSATTESHVATKKVSTRRVGSSLKPSQRSQFSDILMSSNKRKKVSLYSQQERQPKDDSDVLSSGTYREKDHHDSKKKSTIRGQRSAEYM